MIHTKMHARQGQVDPFFRMFSPWLHVPVSEIVDTKGKSIQYPILANIQESDNDYQIALSVPGFAKEEVKIAVENNVLVVTAQKNLSEDASKYILKEWKMDNQTRKFQLPKDADQSNISASYNEGILTISVQKVAKKEPQTIEIK